jgi:hypothetical protein
MLFTEEFNLTYLPTFYLEYEYMLHASLHPSPAQISMTCGKVDKYPEDPEDLEELRNLTFKESKGARPVKNTLSDYLSSSYTKPLKLWKVNIGSE